MGNVFKEYRWEVLQKMLKKESDKLARRQRAFRKKNNNALDKHIKNNFNEDLFKLTDKGYIAKGLEFYKSKNVTYLQKAIKSLQTMNSSIMFKSVREYEKVQTKKLEGVKQYIKDRMYNMNFSDEKINETLNDKDFLDNFFQALNDNTNSKMPSDDILKPLFDALRIEEKALNETLNQINIQNDITKRLFER